jgi:magnesium transporter
MTSSLKLKKRSSKKIGSIPGSLIHIGTKRTDQVKINVFQYNKDVYTERELKIIEEAYGFKESNDVHWIDIDGIHDTEIIGKLGKYFDLHPLLLEDILNTGHRPKVEVYDNCVFFTFKMLTQKEGDINILSEQVSLVLGENYVLSFQEEPGDLFDPIRQRIRTKKGIVRERLSDYLFYLLLDITVDNYYKIVETLDDYMDKLEQTVLENPNQKIMNTLQEVKKQLIILKNAVYPIREAIIKLDREETSFIRPATRNYLKDVHDHTVQLNETIDIYKDLSAGLRETYLSTLSFKMNQIMKVLTLISTIFIPLTFIVGVYGMNFDFMPELHSKYGYYFTWAFMILLSVIMIVWFKTKKWL